MSDADRLERLVRISSYASAFCGSWDRGAAHQHWLREALPTAVRDVLWVDSYRDPFSFDPEERLDVAVLATELAGALAGFAHPYGPRFRDRLVRIGFQFVGTLPERLQAAADRVRSRLFHNYPVIGAERWWELRAGYGSTTARALLAKFAIADAFAARAGDRAGQRESLEQSLRQVVVLLNVGRFREADRLFASARDAVDPSDPFEAENFLVHEAIVHCWAGRAKAAGEALLQRRHLLSTQFTERMEHKEAGNTFFLQTLCPDWVTDADRLAAVRHHYAAATLFDIASDNESAARQALSRLGMTRWTWREFLGERRADPVGVHGTRRSGSISVMLGAGKELKSERAGEADLKATVLPPRPALDPFIAELRQKMLWAQEGSGLTQEAIGLSMNPTAVGPQQDVFKLLNETREPGILTVAKFAQANGLSVSELLELKTPPVQTGGRSPAVLSLEGLRKAMKAAIPAAGKTQAMIAKEWGATEQAVWKFLNQNNNPGILRVHQFARLVDTPLAQLLRSASA